MPTMDTNEKARIRAINESMPDDIRAVLRRVEQASSHEEARDLMVALNVDPDQLPPELNEEIGRAWQKVFEFEDQRRAA